MEVLQGTLELEDGQGDLEMGDLGGDTRACLLLRRGRSLRIDRPLS